MKIIRCLALAAALLGAGCSDDDGGSPAVTNPDGGGAGAGGAAAGGAGGGGVMPDGGAAGAGGAAAGAGGGGTGGGPTTLTIVDWVNDLVGHHTDVTSAPDTVDDKHIIDTDDPSAFDSLLK